MPVRASPSPISGLLRDRRGSAALEFGLVATMVLALLLFAFDVGLSMLQYAQLNVAVRAGGQYAMTFPTDDGGILAAVTAALPSTLQAAVTTTVGCECLADGASGSGICGGFSGSCSSCGAGTTQRFVHVATNVNTSTWLTSPLKITPLATPSACYVARVQ
jgi:Flp pilus assembly protein TadG